MSQSIETEEALRTKFEALVVHDSYGFKRSRRGTYVNPARARDWRMFLEGARSVHPIEIDSTCTKSQTTIGPKYPEVMPVLRRITKAIGICNPMVAAQACLMVIQMSVAVCENDKAPKP